MAWFFGFRTIKSCSRCILNKTNFTGLLYARKTMHKSNSKLKSTTTPPADQVIKLLEEKQCLEKFDVLPTPVKSASDKKDYKVIKLKNGLTACLISDVNNKKVQAFDSDSESSDESVGSDYESESSKSGSEILEHEQDDGRPIKTSPSEEHKMAAASLCVGVGSFSDPKEIPGMAHFLEHMVFMGSKKFPEENDFDSFIKSRGGSDNASTDCETTTFYFECLEKHLLKGLDKFAQFFISPLMKEETITREREAIESEFQMALPSDTYRKEQLLVSFCQPNSPVNSFAWGNLVTLRDNVDDKVLYQNLHKFHKQHYSAHRMTVAIQARLPMEMLESYVTQCFCEVPNNNIPPNDFKMYSNNVFDTPKFKRLYYVKPVKDVTQVDLTWVLPSLLPMYKSKPHQYVSWLLGHEGKGSLLSYLRSKVWVLDIYTGNGESGSEHNSIYALFTVTMVLTKEGLQKLPEVIGAVFSYLQLLRKVGPQERIFKEIQLIGDTSFRFADEETAADLVERVAESMHYYPSVDYLTGPEIYFEYSPQAIEMVLEHLKPENVNIMVLDKNFLPEGLAYNKVEPWFKTEYVDVDIPEKWTEMWKNIDSLPEFALPEPNIYLTEDFSLLEPLDNNPDYPEKVLETPLLELYYRKDETFQLPIAYYHYYLITPLSIESSRSACMLDMYATLLNLQLTEESYPAVLAELAFSISVRDKGIVVKLNGYNEKLPILMRLISEYFVSMTEKLKPDIFEAVKDKIKKAYFNKFLKPSSLAKDLRLQILVKDYYSPLEKYHAIRNINFNMMEEFASKLLKHLYIKGLVQGNVDKQVAVDTTKEFAKTLKYDVLLPGMYPKFGVVNLPTGERYCRVMSFNKNDSNSIITNYYQSGPSSIKNSVIVELLLLIIDEPLFDILRTKEQLGYNVFSTLRDTFGILGYSVTVNAQAVKSTTEHVDERIEEFIKHITKMLKKYSSKKIESIKNDLIKVKQCADVLLHDEVSRNWAEIMNEEYVFDRMKREVEEIRAISTSDIKEFWNNHNFCHKSNKCRKLSIQVVGYNISKKEGDENKQEVECGPDEDYCLNYSKGSIKRENSIFIESIDNFKANLPLYELK